MDSYSKDAVIEESYGLNPRTSESNSRGAATRAYGAKRQMAQRVQAHMAHCPLCSK